jgi:hypothetical protein
MALGSRDNVDEVRLQVKGVTLYGRRRNPSRRGRSFIALVGRLGQIPTVK